MPRNRFAFAVRVGREQDFVGFFGGLADRFDVLGVALDDLVFHAEIGGVHRAGFGLQIADVTIAGENVVIRAQIFFQRLGLGRRLDDNQFGH